MVAVLEQFGFESSQLSSGQFMIPDQIVRLGVPPVRIEIMNTISGVVFQECFEKKVKENWNGVTTYIISLTKLKENKKASGRLKDLNDLEHL